MATKPGFDKKILDRIIYLVARGYEVRGHGYRFFARDGWFCIEPLCG